MGGLQAWKVPVLLLLLLAPVCIAEPYPDWPAPDDTDEPADGEEPVLVHRDDFEFASLLAAGGGSSNIITVTQDPSKLGNDNTYRSIQAAIDAVPDVTTERWIIKIDPGVYFGQVEIEKKNLITLYGDPKNPRSVVLQAKHTAADIDTEGRVYGTYRSPSLIIRGDDFTAIGVTFINLSDRPAPGARGGQAVAVRATGDRHQYYNCIFTSFQDTLYAHKGRQLYKNCLIEGTIDFIFGYAQAQFEDCNIHARADPYSFSAQKRNLSTDPNGFIFLRCNLTCEPSLPGQGQAYLARSWGAHARTYFIDSYLYDVVYPPGYNNMGFPARELTSDFAEFNNTGPGSDTSQRVKWAKSLTLREVQGYRNPARPFINGNVWVEVPEELGPTPEPLVMCSGHDEAGIAEGPMPTEGPPGEVESPDVGLPPAAYNAVDLLVSALDAKGDFATFLYFFQFSGLDAELSASPPEALTFFPPTDSSFNVLSNETVKTLSNDTNLLKRVLSYHIVKGFYPDAVLLTLGQQNLPTLAGFGFPILNKPEGVFVGQDLKAEVTKHDAYVNLDSLTAAQGINRVLLSPFIDYLTPPIPVPVPSPAASLPPPQAPSTALPLVRLAEVNDNAAVRISSQSWRLLGLSSFSLLVLSRLF